MQHFKVYSKPDLLSLTKVRRFETKTGERLQVAHHPEDIAGTIQQSSAPFVLFGIPEDLGAKGNMGIGGTDTLWIPFLQSFLNVQSNDFWILRCKRRRKNYRHADALRAICPLIRQRYYRRF